MLKKQQHLLQSSKQNKQLSFFDDLHFDVTSKLVIFISG